MYILYKKNFARIVRVLEDTLCKGHIKQIYADCKKIKHLSLKLAVLCSYAHMYVFNLPLVGRGQGGGHYDPAGFDHGFSQKSVLKMNLARKIENLVWSPFMAHF